MRLVIFPLLIVLAVGALLSACGGGSGDGGGAPQANLSPTAVISVSKTSGYAPLPLEFDGSQSSDQDGNVTNYSWDFGDGTSSLGSQANHTYTSLGLFTATLTVTDDDGASSSTSVQIKSHAQLAGYYTGVISSNITGTSTELEVIIGTNHEIHAYDWFDFRTSYWGDLSVTEDRATGVLLAEVWDPAFVFVDGSTSGVIDVDAFVFARQSVTGTYNGVGDIGIVDIQYLPALAERPSSLSEVSGTWGWIDGAGFTATLMVSESGELDYSDTDGWIGRGQLVVLDPTLNAFGLQFDWTHPTWNGPTSGLVFVDDFYAPGTHWLVFAESWQAIVNDHEAGSEVWSLERPAPVAIVGSGVEAIKSGIVLSPKRGGRKHR